MFELTTACGECNYQDDMGDGYCDDVKNYQNCDMCGDYCLDYVYVYYCNE